MKDKEDRRDRYVSQLEVAAVEIAVDTELLSTIWEDVRERARDGADAVWRELRAMQDPLRLPEKEWNGNQVIDFDQLQIREVVARGGYGTVRLAMIRVGQSEKPVAVKLSQKMVSVFEVSGGSGTSSGAPVQRCSDASFERISCYF